MFSLISCGDLEPTTIKGNWVSETVENEPHYNYIIQINDDDKYSLKIMAADSIYTLLSGTWTYKGDTISLYSQKGTCCLIVKQLSMDIMTVQRKKGKENIILSRIYNNSNSSDELDKFIEVLTLKGGFWYFLYLAFIGFMTVFIIVSILACLIDVVKWIISKINSSLNNSQS